MPAPKGHEKWGNPLKPKLYSPETLWDGALEYFNSCDENPWVKNEPIKSGDMAGSCMPVETQTPYTKQGLCVWLSVSLDTLSNYEKKEGYETHFGVMKHINMIIQKNQLEGASVGAYNSNIIARLLGLAEKQDITSGGKEIKQTIMFGGKEIEVE